MKTAEQIFDEAIKDKGLDVVSVKDADLYEAGLDAINQALSLGAFSGSYSAEDMSKAWSEGYHRKVDEINGNELRYFDVWLANYR